MKVKTQELTGPALDWAVAVADGYDYDISEQGEVLTGNTIPIVDGDYAGCHEDELYRPSRDWAQGGQIVERELLQLVPHFLSADYGHPNGRWEWRAYVLGPTNIDDNFEQEGPTPLIAAMRCYCCSKLGDEVEIPEELK